MNPTSDRNGYSILNEWLTRMRSTDPLTREQEAEVFVVLRSPEATAGDRERALDRLVRANVRFAFGEAMVFAEKWRHRNPRMDMESLFSASYAALLTAAERFDPTRGFKFISYAVWWIGQSLHLEGHGSRTVHLPTSLFTTKNKIPFSTKVYSLDCPTTPEGSHEGEYGEDGVPSIDMLEAEDQADLAVFHRENLEVISQEILRVCPYKEQIVLKRYYGLDGEYPQTLQEIGIDLGVTRERIRQIRDQALVRLRNCSPLVEMKADLFAGG